MKKYLLGTLIFLSLFSACQRSLMKQAKDELASRITNATATELMNLYNFQLAGIGGSTLGGIRSFFLAFELYRPLTIEEGRRIAVACIELFLRNINNDIASRPFLTEYPFPVSKIEISIHIPDDPTNPRQKGSLVFVDVFKGMVEFKIQNSNDKLETIHEETLEEALKIIREEIHCEKRNGGGQQYVP